MSGSEVNNETAKQRSLADQRYENEYVTNETVYYLVSPVQTSSIITLTALKSLVPLAVLLNDLPNPLIRDVFFFSSWGSAFHLFDDKAVGRWYRLPSPLVFH